MIKWGSMYFNLCLLSLVVSLCTIKKSVSIFFAPFLQIHTDKFPPEPPLLQAEQFQLSQPFFMLKMVHSLSHLSGPSLDSSVSLLYWGHHGWTQHDWCCTERKDHFCLSPGSAFPNAAQEAVGHLCSKWHIAGSAYVSWHPRSFSAKLLSSQLVPSMYWCTGLFLSRCRTSHFPLLCFVRSPSSQFSSLFGSL